MQKLTTGGLVILVLAVIGAITVVSWVLSAL